MRFLVSVLAVLLIAACSPSGNDLDEPPVPLGDFRLGYNVVVAPKVRKEALSREVTQEQIVASLKSAIDQRFSRYEGDRLYHFGVNVEQYFLAPPGVPVVGSPKSILGLVFFIKDDETGENLNDEIKHFVVFESVSGSTVLGSGWTQTAEEQLDSLTRSAAKEIEVYLATMLKEDGWFLQAEE